MSNEKTKSIAWKALEFKHYEKNVGWYVTLLAIAVLVIGFFIIVQNDWFAAITIALLAGFIVFFSRHKPERIEMKLDSKGIYLGELFYPYKHLKYFWVVNDPNHHTVNFHSNTYFNNTVIMELESQDPDEIRDFLLKFLPEHTSSEATVSQRISHRFKF